MLSIELELMGNTDSDAIRHSWRRKFALHKTTRILAANDKIVPGHSLKPSLFHPLKISITVRCKTVAMSNLKPGHEVPYNQLWEFHFALVGTNKVQALGYNFVSRVM